MTQESLEAMCEHMAEVQYDIDWMLEQNISEETERLLRCMRSDMIGLEDRIQGTLY